MASVELRFDEAMDAWIDLDLVAGQGDQATIVEFKRRPFAHLGDVSHWLEPVRSFVCEA